MPKLKDVMDSALGLAEPKKAEPKKPQKSPVHDHIAAVLTRHKGLPTELVEKFYKCPNKTQVKKLLAQHLSSVERKAAAGS